MVKTLALSAAIVIGLTGAALAQSGACTAVVEHVSGSLLVNKGHGFQHLQNRSVLNAGDVIMASGRGAGLVRFSDGSTAQVSVGNAVRVPGKMPCDPLAGYKASYSPKEASVSDPSAGLIGAGVLGIGGILVAIAVLSSHASPVSP